MQVLRHAVERGPVPPDPLDTWITQVFSDYQRRLRSMITGLSSAGQRGLGPSVPGLAGIAERMARESKQWRPVVAPSVARRYIIVPGQVAAVQMFSDGRVFHTWCAPPDTPMDKVSPRDPRLLRSPVCAGCGAGWYE